MLIQTEDTQDPSTMTFLPGRKVLEAGSADFSDAEAAKVSPLAERLYQTGSVKAVALGPDFIRVTRSDESPPAAMRPPGGLLSEPFSALNLIVGSAVLKLEAGQKDGAIAVQTSRFSGAPL